MSEDGDRGSRLGGNVRPLSHCSSPLSSSNKSWKFLLLIAPIFDILE